ncbi:hypothetical protein ACLMJK_004878 [Lecanora helva]
MNPIPEKSTNSQPPEITQLDARIARAGGTSFRIEIQPHQLQQTKRKVYSSATKERDDLVRENGHLRQEIVFYQESRNAMLAFHAQAMEAYDGLRAALRELSEKLAAAEGRLETYWGISLNGSVKNDVTVL